MEQIAHVLADRAPAVTAVVIALPIDDFFRSVDLRSSQLRSVVHE